MDISFDSLLEAEENNHPLIIKLWMQEEIQLETIVILDSILGFVERENKKITDTIIWPDIYRKIMKYKPFVKFDRDKCLNLLKLCNIIQKRENKLWRIRKLITKN